MMSDVDRILWNELLLTSSVFTTRQVSEKTDMRLDSVSRRLKNLAEAGSLIRIRRGLWAIPNHPDFSPYAVVPHLFENNERGYVSLVSALHLHGMIEQIPDVVHIVTTKQREALTTPVTRYEFYKIKQNLFGGYRPYDQQWSFQIAAPEKALFDISYYSTKKGNRFARLPELHLPETFKEEKLQNWLNKVSDRSHRKAVHDRVADVLSAARREKK